MVNQSVTDIQVHRFSGLLGWQKENICLDMKKEKKKRFEEEKRQEDKGM